MVRLYGTQRIITMPHVGDIEFFSDEQEPAIDEESVVEIGSWTDDLKGEIASGGKPPMHFTHPLPNKFQGTIPGIKGERLGNLNVVGQDANIYRRRKKLITMKV